MDEERVVQFDQVGSIRIYDPEKFEEAVRALQTQREYLNKMDAFKSVVSQTMTIVEQLGKAIETEKLRAIGMRNAAEREVESRKQTREEALIRVQEKQIELDRAVAEYNSLQKVEQEQRAVIQRLSFSGSDQK
jgi:intraflagellar transport protein 20